MRQPAQLTRWGRTWRCPGLLPPCTAARWALAPPTAQRPAPCYHRFSFCCTRLQCPPAFHSCSPAWFHRFHLLQLYSAGIPQPCKVQFAQHSVKQVQQQNSGTRSQLGHAWAPGGCKLAQTQAATQSQPGLGCEPGLHLPGGRAGHSTWCCNESRARQQLEQARRHARWHCRRAHARGLAAEQAPQAPQPRRQAPPHASAPLSQVSTVCTVRRGLACESARMKRRVWMDRCSPRP